ncbi:MAG: hypothetical protein ACOH1T_07380 [Microbacteriaceae bacterium]
MNIGRIVVASSAALALIAGFGFIGEVFVAPSTSVAQGDRSCMRSVVSDDIDAAVGIRNTSNSTIVLTRAFADSQVGLTVSDDVWAIPLDNDPEKLGIGIGNFADDVESFGLVPIAGMELAPGEYTQAVFRLTSTDGAGYATDFRIEFVNPYGITHSTTSHYVVGFSPRDIEDGDIEDSDVDCGPR